jgi:hypothetical protein
MAEDLKRAGFQFLNSSVMLVVTTMTLSTGLEALKKIVRKLTMSFLKPCLLTQETILPSKLSLSLIGWQSDYSELSASTTQITHEMSLI